MMEATAIRLPPGAELGESLKKMVEMLDLKAAFIITCVGSVEKGTIRLANATSTNRNELMDFDERYEILSLVGTVCATGFHLHISLGDKEGSAIGGHLVQAYLFTTAELVIGNCPSLEFSREMDSETGFKELVVSPSCAKYPMVNLNANNHMEGTADGSTSLVTCVKNQQGGYDWNTSTFKRERYSSDKQQRQLNQKLETRKVFELKAKLEEELDSLPADKADRIRDLIKTLMEPCNNVATDFDVEETGPVEKKKRKKEEAKPPPQRASPA